MEATEDVIVSMLTADELTFEEWEYNEEYGEEVGEEATAKVKDGAGSSVEDSDDSLAEWAAQKFLSEDDFEFVDQHVGSDDDYRRQLKSSESSLAPSDSTVGGKITENDIHGYTFVEFTELDDHGNKKTVRKFLPRIHRKIRTFKKLVPIKVVFNRLLNDTDIVEEEEEVEEEADVDEITDTIIVKKRDDEGNDYFEQKLYVHEIVKDPGKKKLFIKLGMENDLGQLVEELIELTDDRKRTNDIKRLAAPLLKKKPKSPLDKKAVQIGHDPDKIEEKSYSLSDWSKPKDSQKDHVKMKMIANLKKAREEQKVLKEMNNYLVKKLCEYYDLKGPKSSSFLLEEGGNVEEEKLKYQKRLLEFNDVVNFIFAENKKRAENIAMAEVDVQRDAEELKKEKRNMYALEEAMLKEIDPSEEAKTLRSMTFAELINQQKAMDQSLAKVRLDFIRSQIALKELQDKKAAHQAAIDNMEKVDFINYESLKAMTKDLNGKLDLKEKQVLAMKDRLTQRVQALAHIRLKSDSLTAENEKLAAETKEIIAELNALRKNCLEVQKRRRRLEKELNKVAAKEGLSKYPFLLAEAGNVEMKNRAQVELLGKLADVCTDLKDQLKCKLEVGKITKIQPDEKC